MSQNRVYTYTLPLGLFGNAAINGLLPVRKAPELSDRSWVDWSKEREDHLSLHSTDLKVDILWDDASQT